MFPKDIDKDTLVLLAARASRVENQDAIDASIVGMLGDPKEVQDFMSFWQINLMLIYFLSISLYVLTMDYAGKSRNHRGAFLAFQSCGQAHCNHLY